MTKYSRNTNGDRYWLSDKDRKEIIRGTSLYDSQLLNATISDKKKEMNRIQKMLKSAMKRGVNLNLF